MQAFTPDSVAEPTDEDLEPQELSDEELDLTYDGMPWVQESEEFEDFIDVQAKRQVITKIPAVLPSQFTEFAFRMPRNDGLGYEQFTFEGRRHMIRPYNTSAKRILLFCGRQVEKSTLLGNIILSYSCIVPAYKTLYVSPSATQTKVFSADRIKEPIETSDVLRSFTTSMLSQNIFEKQFVNRAKITLRYAFLNADRCAVGSTRVHFTDGSVATLTEIHATPERFLGAHVWSVDPAGLSVVPACLTDVVDQGQREVHRVRLEGGTESVCTSNQPFLTPTGWRELKDLPVGSFVAVPRQSAHGAGDDRPVEEYRLVALGLIGKNHLTKRVPADLFRGNEEQIAGLLGAIYATDGWASVSVASSGTQYEIGYGSNSRGLCEDIKVLLLRFGVRSCLSRQKKPSTKNAQGAFVLSIRDAVSVRAFCKSIRVLGKESEMNRVLLTANAVTGHKDDRDRVPFSYPQLRTYLKGQYGLSTHTAWAQHKIQLRPGNNRDSIGRRVLCDIACKLDDAYLRSLTESQVGWARIESITSEGVQATYDLTVEETENYLVDGVFIHNTRGIPAWCLALDELQDILADNIPVIEQCTSHAPEKFKRFLYSGTPKSLDNSIEYYRSGVSKDGRAMSTQGEWVVPCDAHGGEGGRYWNVLCEKNIGKTGLICEKCGKGISALHPDAQWAQMVKDGIFESYRIPQLMVPWRSWDEILLDYSRYARDKFYNEVLGLSYDSGMRPLSLGQIKECCNPQITMHPAELEKLRKILLGRPVFAGIDWGCHDEETRILTEGGFKYFRDLTDDDLVAQWDPETRAMSFVKPLARTVRDWDQPLLHLETKGGLDVMVTHTHRMRVGTSQGERWITESAGEFAERGGNAKFVGHVTWNADEQSSFTLPGVRRSAGYSGSEPRVFVMDDWLELLGYLISEGGLCFSKDRPSCLKMSQRQTVNHATYAKIQSCLDRMEIPCTAFPNRKTGDVNWTIYGKQFWSWYDQNVGRLGSEKRVPREFLRLGQRQLRILWQALVDGDGSVDPRPGNTGGTYSSTSRGLCEDFQELCIKLGLRAVLQLHKEAQGNKKAQWRVSWSKGRDYQFNTPSSSVKRVPYNGRVYCCAVPSGYIVTERNGCIAYQGNTGENSYTVMCLGYYEDMKFRIFWIHRFTGEDTDPQVQIKKIVQIIRAFNVKVIGTDYGGGFDRNNILVREFGPARLQKFQYQGRVKKKIVQNPQLQRWLVHKTEVMSDLFAAIKRKQLEFPRFEEFREPFAQDMLNIHSEYNETLRMVQYNHRPDRPDDAFHSILYCFVGSMIIFPRPDIIAPRREFNEQGGIRTSYSGPVYQG